MRTAVGFNVDDIARQHLLLLQAVVDGGVQLQLLGALHTLQANDDMCDDFTIPACLQCTSRFATRLNPPNALSMVPQTRQVSIGKQASGSLVTQCQCKFGLLVQSGSRCIV